MALHFLQQLGYNIIATNHQVSHKEIDIIAKDGDILVFVEVKTRSDSRFQYPEAAVGLAKQILLKSAAAIYVQDLPLTPIRFDIISIVILPVPEIIHLKDAFY